MDKIQWLYTELQKVFPDSAEEPMIGLIESLKKLLEGRGFFASFLVISGWSYALILFIVLLWEIILYLLGVKHEDEGLKK